MKLDARLVTFICLWHGIFCHALTRTEPAKASTWSKLCAISEKLDSRLVSFGDKLESLRTSCMCALNPNMEEKMAILELELDAMRNDCICKTEMKCPEGWEKFQNSCYFYGAEEVTWHDAKKKCEDEGAYLTEVETDLENEFLLRLWKDTDVIGFGPWLGASDEGTEGQWIWDKSGKALNYTKWDVQYKEPNGGAGESCLHIRSESNLGWNDFSCSRPCPYICEKDLQ